MKNLIITFLVISIFSACNSNKLSTEEALKLLQEQEGYPKTIDAEIYTADPVDAKKLIDAGLEKDGFVKIAHRQKIADLGKPIITFTEKAKPYLLPQTEEDLKNKVQRVKVAEEVIERIESVEMTDDGESAIVSFDVVLQNKTPFFPNFENNSIRPAIQVFIKL